MITRCLNLTHRDRTRSRRRERIPREVNTRCPHDPITSPRTQSPINHTGLNHHRDRRSIYLKVPLRMPNLPLPRRIKPPPIPLHRSPPLRLTNTFVFFLHFHPVHVSKRHNEHKQHDDPDGEHRQISQTYRCLGGRALGSMSAFFGIAS